MPQLGPNGLAVIAALFGTPLHVAMEGAVASGVLQAFANVQAMGLQDGPEEDELMDDIVGAAMEEAIANAGINLLGGLGL